MRILGIHDGHNAAACVLEDGVIRAAIQQERITRIKNHDIFPVEAIEWVLDECGCRREDVDAVAMNGFHMPVHRDRQRLIMDTRYGGSLKPGRALRRWARATPVLSLWKAKRRRLREQEAADAGIDPQKLVYIDHHRCHAEAAYWGSAFRGEPVLAITADGAGDDLCATVSLVDAQGKFKRLAAVHESHSPALVYLVVTTLMGMVPNEHEYKLMGMAPYAPESRAEEVCAIFEKMLEWDPNDPLTWRRRRGVPNTYYCYDYLKKHLDLKRFDCVCGGMQLWVERLLAEWIRRAIKHTGVHKVVVAGGIFMNVKANQVIADLAEVEDLFIYPSCGDETNAMGAAYAVYNERRATDSAPPQPLGPIYWGPAFTETEMLAALEKQAGKFDWHKPEDLPGHAAAALAAGEVVARFDGRAEFGARALGNRSILADPSRHDVVRMINEMIKSRDFWMPFACSLAAERAGDYVVNPKGLGAPYMILTFNTTERVEEVQAGTHPYDRTIRPQIVEREWNPGYHALIEAFAAKTGIGGLLNTSFNLHGYPIVNTPTEALEVMLKSGLRRLILGPFWVEKKPGTEAV